jgi:hypothetical protein
MAYDDDLVERIRERIEGTTGLSEKKMFGGLTFLVGGNMACGVAGGVLVVRVGPERYEAALAEPHARECDFTGRPLTGMVMVDPPGYAEDGDLDAWIERGVAFAASLQAKH